LLSYRRDQIGSTNSLYHWHYAVAKIDYDLKVGQRLSFQLKRFLNRLFIFAIERSFVLSYSTTTFFQVFRLIIRSFNFNILLTVHVSWNFIDSRFIKRGEIIWLCIIVADKLKLGTVDSKWHLGFRSCIHKTWHMCMENSFSKFN